MFQKNREDLPAATPANSWERKARSLGLNPHSTVYAIGFNPVWRKYVRQFFQDARVQFVADASRIPKGHIAVIWGRKHAAGLHHSCILLRIEDGFLRSVGLGMQFARPLSWVIDSRGLYFDATGPSDIEYLLNHRDFSPQQLSRAQSLQEKICASRISKYNTPGQRWQKPEHPRVILIAGQVETDASITYGATDIRTNLELVQAVKANNPDAWLVYKPHPDVVAGTRAPGKHEQEIQRYCHTVAPAASLADMLEQCDEVHVNTSLTGFEALLRNKPVTCYGLPFYAGWGLTEDKASNGRRQRSRSLNELIAATLIEYPLYVSRNTGQYATPETILDELKEWRDQPPTTGQRFRAHFGKATRNLATLVTGKK
ncbi:hypothetical protein [Marinobacter vinifirmus]|uniref:capsular polysaccharide export protein, LipB/KpsS family n=1 Tax=Marinobacter vinifirmus TaxID=355591 RepID=UPI0023525789|nr:hypothetical protein [Marinobacter vinifirmus]